MLTNNFSINEFHCKDGTPVPSELFANIKELAENLQKIRDFIGIPILITSGYRTKEYNKKVGGKPNSMHLQGKAADLKTKLKPKDLYNIIIDLIEKGEIKQGGVGLYDSFVHYDIRGTHARW